MFKRLLLLSSASMLAALAANAQSVPVADTTDEQDTPDTSVVQQSRKIPELQPVEIRSLRASQNAPFAHTDLKKAEIARQNLGQDLPMLLQFTPSAVASSDAGRGVGYTGLRIRGTDPTRINVTFNGMPVNDPEEQATYFVDIPDIASSTNSIQVQRGVGTSTNGAGAFGGTISISNLRQMDTAGLYFSSSYGSFNTYKNTLIAGTGLLKGGWQFDIRLSKISSDGYIQRSAADLRSLQYTAGWTPNEKTSFRFLFMPGVEKTGQAWNGVAEDSLANNRTHNELGQKSNGTYYNNQTDNYQQNYYQLFADHRFCKTITGHAGMFLTRGKGYYEEYKIGEYYSNYGLSNVTAGNDTISETDLIRRLWLDNYYYGGVFSLQYAKHNTGIALGGGWTQFQNLGYGQIVWAQNGGTPDNYKWYQHDAQKNDLNVYLKGEQTIGAVTLYGDVQYRNVAYFMNGFRKNPGINRNVNYDFLNPKAGFNWQIAATENERQRMYASVAIANREPGRSAFETDANHMPRPERLTDGEAGYEITRRKWAASANLYYMSYKDQLVLTGKVNDVGAYVLTNVAESYRAGIEIMASYMPCKGVRFNGNATFSQNKINHFTEYIDNYDSSAQRQTYHGATDIAFSPNTIVALTVALTPFTGAKGNKLELDIIGKHVGMQYLDNTSSANRTIKAYTFCNVLVRYSFNVKPFKEVTASLQLNNVFSSLYASNGYTFSYIYGGTFTTQNYYYPQAGFNALGGITLRW